jgi:hypothetical protein
MASRRTGAAVADVAVNADGRTTLLAVVPRAREPEDPPAGRPALHVLPDPVDEYVARVVADAPPMSPEIRERLTLIFCRC